MTCPWCGVELWDSIEIEAEMCHGCDSTANEDTRVMEATGQ